MFAGGDGHGDPILASSRGGGGGAAAAGVVVERQAIVDRHPSAEPGELESDIDEYESLVAAMFTSDPALLPDSAPAPLAAGRVVATRLEELQRKLFG